MSRFQLLLCSAATVVLRKSAEPTKTHSGIRLVIYNTQSDKSHSRFAHGDCLSSLASCVSFIAAVRVAPITHELTVNLYHAMSSTTSCDMSPPLCSSPPMVQGCQDKHWVVTFCVVCHRVYHLGSMSDQHYQHYSVFFIIWPGVSNYSGCQPIRFFV